MAPFSTFARYGIGALVVLSLLVPSGTWPVYADHAAPGTPELFTFSRTTVTPSAVRPGDTVTIETYVTAAQPVESANIDLEIKDSANRKIDQQVHGGQRFNANEPRSYRWTWHAPADLSSGTYTIKLGAFTADWSRLTAWNNDAARFRVSPQASAGDGRKIAGASLQPLTPELARNLGVGTTRGVLVASIDRDSGAAQAGLQRGDVIVAYDGKPVDDPQRLAELVRQTPAGKSVELTVRRANQTIPIPVTMGALTAEEPRGIVQPHVAQRLGIRVEEINPEHARRHGLKSDEKGLVVTQVAAGSPAARAGIAPGDIVREVNQRRVQKVQQFEQMLERETRDARTPGEVLLRIERNGTERYIVVNVG
jgi:membrane-associated protease RseP (regulator of RpoE activity)